MLLLAMAWVVALSLINSALAAPWPTPANAPAVEQATVSTPPPTAADRSTTEVCSWALNWMRSDWETRVFSPDYVTEAKRRNLTVDDCRSHLARLREPKIVVPPSDPSSRAGELPDGELCGIALSASRWDWETKAIWAAYVAEAKRRALRVIDCRLALGLGQPDNTAPPPGSSRDERVKRYQLKGGAAVELSKKDVNGKESPFITVQGMLEKDDEKSFRQAATIADSAIVALNSPGGDLKAGLQIGYMIRLKGFATLVLKGRACQSACALAWLAGKPRYMERGARIGFHAPRRADDARNRTDSAATAIVGAYMSRLGLRSRAIQYMTEKKPTDMQYLTMEDAERLGIDVKEFKRK